MLDFVVFGLLVLGFATFVTVHVALCVALLFSRPTTPRGRRWHGAVALLIPPLAAIWGWRERRHKTVVVWLFALVVYGVARIIALAM